MTGGRRRARGPVPGAALVVAALAGLAAASAHGWVEEFSAGRLDPSRWERIVAGDLRDWSADVVPARDPGRGFRLRLRADTRGTRDETLKHVGVRTRDTIPLRNDTHISVRVDWGDQANGSYLSGAVVLSPHATARSPLETADWLKVAYVGVPPGRNARMLVGLKRQGRERTVYTDGWPDVNPAGRRIGVQDVSLRVRDRSVEVWEGEQQVWRSEPDALEFAEAFVYLQLSSHSNYPARAIHFERIAIQQIARP
jgi:hypothetical protein